MVFGEYYKDKGQFVPLNKISLEQIELELQNILNADIGECISRQYTGDPGGLKVKQKSWYTDLPKTKYNDCWIGKYRRTIRHTGSHRSGRCDGLL